MKDFAARTVAAMVLMLLAVGSVSTALALTPQKITFGKLGNKTFGAAPFTVSAKASSGLPVSFASTTTGVCTVDGNRVTLIGAGKCTIRASQAGNATYAAAPNVDQSFTVAKASQTIAFAAPGNKTFDAAPLPVSAIASSGLPVTFTSTTASVCTVAGAVVSFVKTGTCTIRAAQAGNLNYNAAANVNQSFTIAKGNQTINLVQPGDKPLGTPPFAVAASATSGLGLTLAPLTPWTCSASGVTVTILALGSCAIQVMQAGDASFNAAPTVTLSFTVTPIAEAQTIAFAALADRGLGSPPFTIGATASSGLPVIFASLTPSVCTVSGSTVTLAAAGTCTIRASQPGDSTYAAAANVDRSFIVAGNVNVTIRYTHDAVGNLIGVDRVQ